MISLMAKIENRLRSAFWKAIGFPKSFDDLHKYEMETNYRYTRCLAHANLAYKINLDNPKSFNEKAIHRRLHSRDEIWPIVTDKVEVRNWLRQNNLLGDLSLVPIRGVFSNPEELRDLDLTRPGFVKAAWASGYNIQITDGFSKNIEETIDLLRKWKNENYFPKRLIWAAEVIPRRFIVEDYLGLHTEKDIVDYKFYVFHGRVALIQVISDRHNGAIYSHFTRELKQLSVKRVKKRVGNHTLPSEIKDLIREAEAIGQHFDFARVDLYLLDGKIYFGEITQTPVNGFAAFDPVSYDYQLGGLWNYEPHR
jgi:hypothetical protein